MRWGGVTANSPGSNSLLCNNHSKISASEAFQLHMRYSMPLALFGAAAIATTCGHAQSTPASSILGELVVRDYALKEEKPDGSYAEPEWVRQRRFSNTRVYIQKDPWEVGVEEWYRTRSYDGGLVTQ